MSKSNNMRKLHHYISNWWIEIALIGVYLTVRLINLQSLPIFNDEAIYLDWGRLMLGSGQLFFSLFDGKQPLLMWVYGIAMRVIPDPLVAGRGVGVVFGLFSLSGVYLIARYLYGITQARWAGCLYVLAPVFVFYDRQALMESGLMAVGIWSLYWLIRIVEERKGWLLGALTLIWSLGLWIKSSAIVFGVCGLVAILVTKTRDKKQLVVGLGFVGLLSLILLVPLMVQPGFENVLRLNSRFALSLGEIFKLPIRVWIDNTRMTIEVLVWLVAGPFIVTMIVVRPVFLGLKNLRKIIETKQLGKNGQIYSGVGLGITEVWVLLGILMFVLSSRSSNPRYLVAFLPVITVVLGKWVSISKWREKIAGASVGWLLLVDVLLVTQPLMYFNLLERLTRYSQKGIYTGGFTAGYGVREAIDYVDGKIRGGPALVATRLDAGNPENAVSLYLGLKSNVTVSAWGIRPKDSTDDPSYINLTMPVYFISREMHLNGHDEFLELEEKFMKPDGKSWVGVWKVKNSF